MDRRKEWSKIVVKRRKERSKVIRREKNDQRSSEAFWACSKNPKPSSQNPQRTLRTPKLPNNSKASPFPSYHPENSLNSLSLLTGILSVGPPIGKFIVDRTVCAP
jgi:hypothetical protein